jgi:putative permease
MNALGDWFRRHLSDPQVVLLTGIVLFVAGTLYFFGGMLAPLLAAVVIAYLLEGLVSRLEERGVPHFISVLLVFVAFLAVLLFLVFGLLPLVTGQVNQLLRQIPSMLGAAQQQLSQLPDRYPGLVSREQLQELLTGMSAEIFSRSQALLQFSLSSLLNLFTMGVYLILVPILVFFFLKDKDQILAWFGGFLPGDRQLTTQVWSEVNAQIANYVRGKFWEIFIVGSVAFATFRLFGLQYSLLLAVVTGFSVLIPYIGALMVTLPVALVGYAQFGLDPRFIWLLVAYGVIQFLDGNLLVPLLFSEAVNLHPVAIIAAVLVFGGLWGFWGLFFAIPLATVIQAVLRAWPSRERTPMAVETEEAA